MTTRRGRAPLLRAMAAGLLVGMLGAATDQPGGSARATPVIPLAYRLDLTIIPERPRFGGHVEIDVDVPTTTRTLAIDGKGLTVAGATVRTATGAVAARYAEADGQARLQLARPIVPGRATLVLDYDAAFADVPDGLYHAAVGGRWYVWSQLEPIQAREVFPSIDEPGFKTPFAISVATTSALVAIGNAPVVSERRQGPLVRYRFAPTPPLPTYLIAVAVGPFRVSAATSGVSPTRPAPIPMRIAAPQGAPDPTLALTQTGPILAQLERYMDRPYPYAKLDQIASPLMVGAMENAAAVVYDQDVLLPRDPDSPVSQRGFVRDISHELAHQWFGDLVTPKSWDDLWVNESFANWMSYRIGDRWRPELQIGVQMAAEAIDALEQDQLSATHPVHQRTADGNEPLFDSITYGKGGQVLSMVEGYLGEETFRAGLQLYLQRYAGRNAGTADFFAALADAVGDPIVSRALLGFVDQPGVPVLRFERTVGGYRISQSRYRQLGDKVEPQQWRVPVCYRADTARSCLMLTGTDATIAVRGNPVIMPNADGTGYYRFSLPADDWRALLATSPSLPPAEALMTIDSLWADFAAGQIAPDLLIDAARHMTANPFGAAAIASGERLAALRRQGLLAAEDRARYDHLLVSLYRPVLDQLGFDASPKARAGESAAQQQLRLDLEGLLADEAEDPATLARLADAAEQTLAGDKGALAPTLQVTAFAAYLTANPKARVPALFERMATAGDRTEREIDAYALGSHRTGPQAGWLLDRLSDPRLTFTDRRELLQGLAEEPATRPAALRWIVSHLDLLSRQSLPELVVSYGGNACSAADAELWSKAIGPRVARDPGARLALAVALERVGNCEALRLRRGAALSAALG